LYYDLWLIRNNNNNNITINIIIMTDWRNITWIMLHTYTVKIKTDIVISNINDIKKFLYLVINNLPCTFCVQKSNKYFTQHIKSIIDKPSLILFMYNFHNMVNLELNKQQFDYLLIDRYYLTKRKEIFNLFNNLPSYNNEIKLHLLNNNWFNE